MLEKGPPVQYKNEILAAKIARRTAGKASAEEVAEEARYRRGSKLSTVPAPCRAQQDPTTRTKPSTALATILSKRTHSHSEGAHHHAEDSSAASFAIREFLAEVEEDLNLTSLARLRGRRLLPRVSQGNRSQMPLVEYSHLAHRTRCDGVCVQLLHKPGLDALVVIHMLTSQAGSIPGALQSAAVASVFVSNVRALLGR